LGFLHFGDRYWESPAVGIGPAEGSLRVAHAPALASNQTTMTVPYPRNPLHGITLGQMLVELVETLSQQDAQGYILATVAAYGRYQTERNVGVCLESDSGKA